MDYLSSISSQIVPFYVPNSAISSVSGADTPRRPSTDPQVGQRKQCDELRRVLLQTLVAHLGADAGLEFLHLINQGIPGTAQTFFLQ